ncbi:MAG: putative acetyltransferase [Cyanobacteria bacterium RYN_339]|nr:putative acetyltransferase [Cyanobacteria bacterium RYN_339]
MFQSAVLRSEAALIAALGDVADHGRYVRFRTPGMPGNNSTNALIFRGAPGPEAALEWPTLLAREFADEPPGSRQRLSWDPCGEASPEVVSAFEAAGFEAFTVCVLATDRPLPGDAGAVAVRKLVTDADWADACYVSALIAPAPPGPRVFAYHRSALATYRAACEAGHGAFFGAWLAGVCVGLLGIFVDGDGLARYQWIIVAPHHRRLGVCRTLMHTAAAWADARQYVVLGLGHNEAGLGAYRRAGFQEIERQTWFWERRA